MKTIYVDHTLKDLKTFQKCLLEWFSREGKSYPWRTTRDPWHILISEIMLQQTTVASVIANRRFEKFLEEFPDLNSIANASEEQILRAWEGLGYYNRVRNLQKTARSLIDNRQGLFPKSALELETLPGVGKYTAGAVSSFAFNEPSPIVDGNIARVLSRLFDYREAIDSTQGQKQLWKWAGQLLDQTAPRLFNSAIMELGQTYCTAREARCEQCPVRKFCQCRDPLSLPLKKPRKKFLKIDEHAFLFVNDDEQILLSKGDGGRRKGFWHLPLRSAEDFSHLEPKSRHRYTITHHRVTVHLYPHDPGERLAGESFVPIQDLHKMPIASPIRKIIEASL